MFARVARQRVLARSVVAKPVRGASTEPPNKVVVEQLLRTVGTKQDVEQYIKFYGGIQAQRFAVIKVGGEVIRDELDTFASALATLRSVGLSPIVVHGAGPQMNQVMEDEGIEPQYEGGMRVTDGHVLSVARRVFQEANLGLCNRLEEMGTPCRPIAGGVFEAEIMNEKVGFVGEVTKVNTKPIMAALEAGYLPVLLPLAETTSGQILNVNADVAAREMAIAVQPLKTIFINAKGGWIEPDGTKLRNINMSTDYEEMASRDYTGRQGTLLKLNELKKILDVLPPPSSISLTSASGLVRELFTHRGSGTLVQHGEPILQHTSLDDVDTPRLTKLLHESFGQQMFNNMTENGVLRPNYLQDLADTGKLSKLYVSRDYNCAAILQTVDGPDGLPCPYLCKFAVTPQAMGQGAAEVMWAMLKKEHPTLLWRSHSDCKEINAWFFNNADGTRAVAAAGDDKPPWTVFWYGLPEEAVESAVAIAASKPRSYFSNTELQN